MALQEYTNILEEDEPVEDDENSDLARDSGETPVVSTEVDQMKYSTHHFDGHEQYLNSRKSRRELELEEFQQFEAQINEEEAEQSTPVDKKGGPMVTSNVKRRSMGLEKQDIAGQVQKTHEYGVEQFTPISGRNHFVGQHSGSNNELRFDESYTGQKKVTISAVSDYQQQEMDTPKNFQMHTENRTYEARENPTAGVGSHR